MSRRHAYRLVAELLTKEIEECRPFLRDQVSGDVELLAELQRIRDAMAAAGAVPDVGGRELVDERTKDTTQRT